MLRQKLYDFFQTHKVLNFTSLAEYLAANGVFDDNEDIVIGKLKISGDIDPTTEVLGKTIADLQENIVVENGVITGTSHYVTDFTDFSETSAKQEGNFLVLKIETNGETLISMSSDMVQASENSDLYVFRIDTDSDDDFGISVIKGAELIAKVFDLTEITFEEEKIEETGEETTG